MKSFAVFQIISILLISSSTIFDTNAQITLNAPSGNGESNYQWYDASSGLAVAIIGEENSDFTTSTSGVYFANYQTVGTCGGATQYFVLKDDCADPSVTFNMGTENGGTNNQWFSYTSDPNNLTTLSEISTSLTTEASIVSMTYFMRATTGDCVVDLPRFTVLNLRDCDLPVELITFKGKNLNGQVNLFWQTATEINNSHFEVERSLNGKQFELLGRVEGNGNMLDFSNYEFVDESPKIGINYYRLKQVDFNEAFQYSKIISVEYDDININKPIQIFPNPSNGITHLQIDNPSKQNIAVIVYNNLGKTVWENSLIGKATNWQQINLETDGIYLITVHIDKEIYYERLLIVNR